METTLHRQLKDEFCDPGAQVEVKLGNYRIDVVSDNRLIEIQRSSLSAIRDKIGVLLKQGYTVDVVKPLVLRKRLVKLNKKDGKGVDRRWRPTRGTILDVFDELIYFTRVFPHPNLTVIAPMVEIEEIRYPGRGKRRRRRKNDFVIQDRQIVDLHDACFFRTVQDLHSLLPKLPETYTTSELSKAMDVPLHQAQKINYVMRKTGAAIELGKQGRSILCRLASKKESKKELSKRKPKKKPPLKVLAKALEKSAEAAAKSAMRKTRPQRKTTTKKLTTKKPTTKKTSKR